MLQDFRRGTVYGVLMNHAEALAALGDAVHAPPYKAPPRAPVLYVKPRNTWVAPGGAVVVPSPSTLAAEAAAFGGDAVDPAAPVALEVGATIGLVIGRTACRVEERSALEHVAGCALVADLRLPHPSYYRPSLRYLARDTFCAIGPTVPLAPPGADPARRLATLRLDVTVDGTIVRRLGFDALVRSPARLLAEVSDFITLRPGDVLLLGVAADAPRARAGQRIAIEADGLGRIEHRLVDERELEAAVHDGMVNDGVAA